MLQVKLEDLGIIRFISPPQGGMPLSIRKQWVGVEVPCLFSHDGVNQPGDGQRDVMTDLEVPDYPGYIVLQTLAIQALQKKAPDAAAFWRRFGYPKGDIALFLFNLESAEVVKPVMTRSDFWKRYADA